MAQNQQRIVQVFASLDQACLEGAVTYSELIEFVRRSTGKGCSTKCVSKWKKQRGLVDPEQGAGGTRGPLWGLGGEGAGCKGDEFASLTLFPDDRNSGGALPPLVSTARNSPLLPCLAKPSAPIALPRTKLLQQGKLFIAGILLGLTLIGQQQLHSEQPFKGSQRQTAPATPTAGNSKLPKTLKFKLSLSSPKDLKVRQGDTISVGQVVAEKVEERSHLTAQRQTLALEHQQLATKTILTLPAPVPVPIVKNLPPISYDEEQAMIFSARLNVRQAEKTIGLQQQRLNTPPLEESALVRKAAVEVADRQRLVNNQHRKIAAVAMLKDLPEEVMPHEQEVLKRKEAELQQATADYQLAEAKLNQAKQAASEKLQQLGVALEKARAEEQIAIAKLQTKKDSRAYTEYEASVAASRRAEERNFAAISYLRQLQEAEQQQRDRAFQLTQIKAKITEVERQIASLAVVTSPYKGIIKSIKIQRQTNNNLSVELTLMVL